MKKPQSDGSAAVDDYLMKQEPDIRARLKSIRAFVKEIVPDAEEKLSYGIPTFRKDGILLHYAAFKKHIGLYPGPPAIEHFSKELSGFKTSTGTIQVTHKEELPMDLIRRIVEYNLENKLEKAI